ncbi:MAG: DUF2189 domain-containing protein [Geminicoccaceae bacterium]|nr:DUF2189 domain-containing protein [Geminicoccaceae bacterium]MDW8342251.1 DUF2189 domain-containing protein [Geminicoccaceae bacterium]
MAEARTIGADASRGIRIRRIELDQPWHWLAEGWRDFRANPALGLFYGALAALTGYLILFGLWWAGMLYLVLPLLGGFLIVGPILTVGLYEAARRREEGRGTTFFEALAAFRRNPSQIALMGVALLLLMFAWVRLAALLFMLYFGGNPPSFENLFAQTFLEPDALPFLVIGTGVGGILAFIAFSMSVISIPLLLDRPDVNVIEAIVKSFEAVQVNFFPLLLWAALIVVFTVAGLVTLFIGLAFVLPILGFASWHAYSALVEREGR